jgi:hypothetical protein
MIPWLNQLPVWVQALIDAAPWCVLVILTGALAPCWPWWDDEDDGGP